jgi:predicted HTH transcriptional regulator
MGLDNPLDAITQEDLQELIDNRVAERRVIDYKQELHFSSDKERKEFLFDIASFANAGGGHLLYGISEVDGYPDTLVGIAVDSEDGLIRQIESRVRDGIAPRVRVEVEHSRPFREGASPRHCHRMLQVR